MFINKRISKTVVGLTLFFLFSPFFSVSAHEGENHKAVIFYNEACGGCTDYLKEVLEPILQENGIKDIVWKDYISVKENRTEYNSLAEEWGIPLELRSHIMAFVSDELVLAGHIPEEYIRYLLKTENISQAEKIIIYQDVMHGDVKDYKIWAFNGPIKDYSIDTSPSQYLDWYQENKNTFNQSKFDLSRDWSFKNLFPLILVSGFLDGINPCAFAVLLFFIAFLFTIRRTKSRIFLTGIVYILAIYIIYFLIGLGLLQALVITGAPHLMAKIGSGLVIILGLINLVNVFFPRFPVKLKIPHFSKVFLEKWIHKATLPAAFILGILVGLCTFPCSGGIYVAVVTLLAAKATYFKGLGYLFVYNFMFIVPLLIILFGAANKYMVEKMSQWEQSSSKKIRLWSGILMVLLGLIILIFFI